MALELAPDRPVQHRQNEWNDNGRENGVGEEDTQVKRPHSRGTDKHRRPVVELVSQVTDQEQRARYERQAHAPGMWNDAPAADKPPTGGYENRAGAVQAGVERWKICSGEGQLARYRVSASGFSPGFCTTTFDG